MRSSDGAATAFAATAEAAAYVPCAGAEQVLAVLEAWACDAEVPVCVLRGPEGAGKSMLLAVLAARVGRHAIPVVASAPGLDSETLARRLLDALGTPWEGSPRVALARAVEAPGARRLLLLVDDGDGLAPRTEMWLFDFVRRSAGAVRVLLAVRDARLAAELAAAFRAGTRVLALDVPMSRAEAEAWIRAELNRGGVDAALRGRFDDPTVERLYARSGGWPGRLRQEAAAILAELAGERHPPRPAAPVRELLEPRASASGREPISPREPPSREFPPRVASGARPPAPQGSPTPPRVAATARAAAATRPAPPGASRPTHPGVASGPTAAVERPRRDSRLRWLRVPAALALAYGMGFLTSQVLGVARPDPTRDRVVRESGRPRGTSATDPEPLRPAAAPPSVAARAAEPVAAPSAGAGELAPPALASRVPAAEPPAVSAPPPPAAAPAAGEGAEHEAAAPSAGDPGAVASLAPSQPAQPATDPAPRTARAAPVSPRSPAPPRPVAVRVEAEPGAAVLIDGRPVGVGAVDGLELAPGPHRVEVRLPDGRVVERVVEVRGTRFEVKVR